MVDNSLPAMFHTGIIVQDLDAAMRDWTSAFGFTWAPPMKRGSKVRIPGGGISYRESRITYSIGGPHHIELLEQTDDTAWRSVKGGPIVHHVGYSVADLAGEVARLQEIGFEPEVSGIGADGGIDQFCYLNDSNGRFKIELVADTLRTQLDDWMGRQTEDAVVMAMRTSAAFDRPTRPI